MATLLETLQGMFANGTIDFTSLGISALPPLLAGASQPTTFNIASPNGWRSNGAVLTFTGTSSTTLFGVPNPSIYMQFVPDNNNSYAFLLDIALPNSWILSQGILQFKDSLMDDLALVIPDSGPQPWAIILCSEASSDPLRLIDNQAIQVAPGVNFFGQFDPASGALAELSFLQEITTSVMNVAVWSFSSGTYAANPLFNIVLATLTTDAILPSGDQLSVQLSLVCNSAGADNTFQAGISLSTSITAGSTQVALTAFWGSADVSLLKLIATGLSIPLPTDAELASIFGTNVSINSVVPVNLASSITVALLEFDISLTAKQLQSAELTLAATDNQNPFSIGPVSVPSVSLSVTYTPGPTLAATLTASGTISQNGASLTIVLTGEYANSAYSFTGQVTGTPSLQTVVTAIFGSDAPSGLPTTVDLTKLTMNANVTKSTYTLGCDFSGSWEIPNTNVSFESVSLKVTNDPSLSGSLNSQWAVGENNFDIEFDVSSENVEFTGSWTAAGPSDQITFVDIATALGITNVPALPPSFNFGLQSATLQLDSSAPSFDFTLSTASNNQAGLFAAKDASSGNWGFVFGMDLGLSFTLQLSDIPVIGNLVPSGLNALSVDGFRIVAATQTVVQPPASQQSIFGAQVNSGLAGAVDLTIGTSNSKTITFQLGGSSGSGSSLVKSAPADVGFGDSASNTPAPSTGWLTVQRSFGPLFINQVGFSLSSGVTISIFLDATITLGPLSMAFTGLEASMALQPVGIPTFDLQGLQISYQGGVTISGGLLFETGSSPAQYSGSVLVKAANFTILGLGTYIDSSPPALAGFFFVSAELGGPPIFFVTGLAAGFGYNTSLQLPSISGVASFPLVAGATGQLGTDPSNTQTALQAFVQESMNEDWLAFGVAFSSYELISSFVLLTVEFGTQLEIAILGESTLSFPPPSDGESSSTPIAQAQLVLEATLQPDIGQLAVNAQLTPASFVLSQAAQLTGGFAYYQWFGSNPNAGDFVITLGGYNPYWTPPTYYPTVPALGLNWTISSELAVTGELYFALSPLAIMAGGSLSAVFNSGPINAWFDADANFLMQFQPFSYQANVSVSIGVSVTVTVIVSVTITVHVGVGVQFYGPPFGGTASIDLSVVSFTISFGASPNPPPAVSWTDFSSSFLPSNSGSGSVKRTSHFKSFRAVPGVSSGPPDPPAPSPYVNISAADGLIANTGNFMQLDPLTFVLNVSTQVPSTSLTINGTSIPGSFAPLGIGPMNLGAGNVTSSLAVTIDQWNDATGQWNQDNQQWIVSPVLGSVPAGLWANTSAALSNPRLVMNALVGFTVAPGPSNPDQTLPIPVNELLVGPGPTIVATLSGSPATNWSGQYSTVWQEVQTTAVNPLELPQSAVLASLAAQGLTALPASINLASFVSEAPDIYTNEPVLAALGADQ